MSRILKFKIFDKKEGKDVTSVYGDNFEIYYPEISLCGNVYFSRQTDYGTDYLEHINGEKIEDRFIIRQFIGVVDINGVEVYEGDIVEITTPDLYLNSGQVYLCEVKSDNLHFYLDYTTDPMNEYLIGDKPVFTPSLTKYCGGMKIIGNVYAKKSS